MSAETSRSTGPSMLAQTLTSKQFEHYLRLLGVPDTDEGRRPTLQHLEALVSAHLTRVPFENISKLYYRKHLGLRTLPGVDHYHEGQLVHGYVLKPEPRRIEEFAHVIEDSFRENATFMNALLLVRFEEGRSIVIRNMQLIHSEGTESHASTFKNRNALVEAVELHFGILAPIVAEVVPDLGLLRDTWD